MDAAYHQQMFQMLQMTGGRIDPRVMMVMMQQAQQRMQQLNPTMMEELMRNGVVTLPDGTQLRISPEELAEIRNNDRLSPEQKARKVFQAALRNRILDSGAIRQEDKASCVAASLEKVLAKVAPDMYEKLSEDLRSVGMSVGPKGQLIALSEENRQAIDAMDVSEEQKISLRLQSAFMDAANGLDRYDATSGTSIGDDGSGYTGLGLEAAAQFSAQFGVSTVLPAELASAAAEGVATGDSDQRMLGVIESRLESAKGEGQPYVAVFLNAGADGMAHQVCVTAIGDGSVTFDDPARGEVTMEAGEFLGQIAMDVESVGHGLGWAAAGQSALGRGSRTGVGGFRR